MGPKAASSPTAGATLDTEALVQAITQRVMAELAKA
jgi:hypothetical protein